MVLDATDTSLHGNQEARFFHGYYNHQLRLYFSSLAYVLLDALRRLALSGTDWAAAQVGTIRLRLLKVAAEVRFTARRIRVRYSSAYPWKHFFAAAWQALRC